MRREPKDKSKEAPQQVWTGGVGADAKLVQATETAKPAPPEPPKEGGE